MRNENEEYYESEEQQEEMAFVERKRILFFGLPWTFTKYMISESFVTVKRGLFSTTEDDCYMYKIQDVKLKTSFMEKLCGVSTVICYTGDVTDKTLELTHVRHGKEIKSYLLKTSEEARIKRRTLHTQDISAREYDEDEYEE